MKMHDLQRRLSEYYTSVDGIYHPKTSIPTTEEGYWSNLSPDEQSDLLRHCDKMSTKAAIRKLYPNLEDIIFDPMRSVGLEFLDITEDQTGIDYGCMWGNLLLSAAKRCRSMIGIDQTKESLVFLQKRLSEDNLDNVHLINQNLNNPVPLNDIADFAIVNGVLEWIPEEDPITLGQHFGTKRFRFRQPTSDPRTKQRDFLTMVGNNLKDDGTLYIAIENRWDYQYFLWHRDPHSNLFYTSIVPRFIANIISNLFYGRPYVNYTYSMNGLCTLLEEAGFNIYKKYVSFPDYRLPQKIIQYMNMKSDYYPVHNTQPTNVLVKKMFRKFRRGIEIVIFKHLHLHQFAPAFIILAKRNSSHQ